MKKNITRVILGLVVSAFVAPMVMALATPSSVELPVDQHGQTVSAAMGKKYKVFGNSTTETVVCSRPCIVYGVFITSGATSNYLILRDSTTAGGATPFLPEVYMPGSGKNLEVPGEGVGLFPIKTTLGLTIDAAAADGFSSLVIYQD